MTASGSSIGEAKNNAELLTGEPMFTGYTELLVVDGTDCRDILGHMLNEWKVSPSFAEKPVAPCEGKRRL